LPVQLYIRQRTLTKQRLCEVLANIDWTHGFPCWYSPTSSTFVYLYTIHSVYCLRRVTM